MTWPGENLMIRLWETLAEKGIGGLLKPGQIRREGVAQIDVKRYQILALADAEREAEAIRQGSRALNDNYSLSSVDQVKVIELPDRTPLQIAATAAAADSLRREINVAKAIVQAEEEL